MQPLLRTLRALCAVALLGTAGATQAAAYPDKPVRLIVPYAAGGGTDTAARMIARKLAPLLGQPVVVENKPGGATQIGTAYVASAAPDGYTLLMGTANLATNSVLYAKLPYDVKKNLAPIVWATDVPVYLLLPAASPWRSLDDLKLAAAQQQGLTFATAGTGSIPHLAGEQFAHQTGIALRHIPYKGSSEAATALIGGQVQMSFDNLPPVYAQVKAGRLRAVAIAAQTRNPELPDVPTLTELGVPLSASSWWGVMAPAGTPQDVIALLNRQINAVLADPEVRSYFTGLGMQATGGTPEAFGRHIAEETDRWRAVVKQAGVKSEE
ncbi:Bug family tripartite tricarboxylate transporter substrate binding protein [Achromobacter anxifer]|uniref:Bug family tripartite tricarboxylate transporter substrate binding protein n=1 Tax=Achromobacter anxifer TaxID=1287737 RepID=UPI0023F9CE0D|nr:tripartite tricarboxylate transporter substrate binding protein [Achromobacter anxifer]MDF8361386.1 tripartite tricarboxylate transporter substrate binding protein [Achromobacter anxifer]